MKNTILFFTLLTLVAFSSCDKKDYDKEDWDKDKWEKDSKKDKDYDKGCFKLVYPITYTMPDGTTISGDEETINTTMKDWYAANPTSEEKPTLNYPVDIIFKDETTQNIADEAAMILAKKDCYGNKEGGEMENCTWNELTEAGGSEFEKYIVKELKISDNCGCIYEGVEKFVENGKTKFMIYYGEKDCVGYGYKVTCDDGNCEKGEKCKFTQTCDGN